MNTVTAAAVLKKYQHDFHTVVPFIPGTDRLLPMDFTESNTELTKGIIENDQQFIAYISNKLQQANVVYGIGGYNEHRTVYSRSTLFDAARPGEEPRRLHLGIDLWGAAGTPVYAFMGGRVHSFAFNNNRGDYGATIVLQHQLEGITFHTLYGHLGLQDIATLSEAQYVTRGQRIAHFGVPEENGHWPPHLHFQVIIDMELKQGDYPGVCRFSERAKYLLNCPDPDLILQMNQYIG